MRRSRVFAAFAALLVAAVVLQPVAFGQTGATEPAPDRVIKVDIEEIVLSKAHPNNVTTYFVRKKLREAGLQAWSARMLPIDKKAHDKAVAAAKSLGKPVPEFLEETKPAPKWVVKGKVTVEEARTSTFYDAKLATIYRCVAKIEILDASGALLATVDDTDEWGRQNEKQARAEAIKRIGLFVTSSVLKSEPVQSALDDAGKKAVAAFTAKIDRQRRQSRSGS